jgi:hypothetical protein
MTTPPCRPSLRAERTPAELCREVESRHEGWHVWLSERGHPWATRTRHGSARTLEGISFEWVDQVIAAFEWDEAHRWAARS